MEAVVTTDWHLDVLNNIFRGNPEHGIKLQMKDIEKVFDYALENGIKNVLVPGDLGQNDQLSSIAEVYLLKLLMKYDGILDIHIIPGNHDYNRLGVHGLQLLELLCVKNKFQTVFFYPEPTLVKIEGEDFYFIPFPYANGKEDAINVAHIEPKGAKKDNGKVNKQGLDVSESPWIIGHLHTYQTLGKSVLPGTLYQCNFGEKLPKGFLHIKVKDGKLKHKFIEIQPSFTFNTLEIVDSEDWARISKRENDFYRVYVGSSLTIPDEIYTYPNVLQISGKIKERDPESELVADQEVKLIDDDEDFLKSYLQEVFHFNKYQVKRSLSLISEAKSKL